MRFQARHRLFLKFITLLLLSKPRKIKNPVPKYGTGLPAIPPELVKTPSLLIHASCMRCLLTQCALRRRYSGASSRSRRPQKPIRQSRFVLHSHRRQLSVTSCFDYLLFLFGLLVAQIITPVFDFVKYFFHFFTHFNSLPPSNIYKLTLIFFKRLFILSVIYRKTKERR